MFSRSPFPRVVQSPVGHLADANIVPRYPIEQARWIWLPEHRGERPALARCELEFEASDELSTVLHVSADERFMLWLDGELLARGPDLSDPGHWAFASYAITLKPGRHRLEALVWWFGEAAPFNQMHLRPGFILAAEDRPDLATGHGPWRIAEIPGVTLGQGMPDTFQLIGPSLRLDAHLWFAPPQWLTPRAMPMPSMGWGTKNSSHRLHPTPLPEQRWSPRKLGRARAARPLGDPDAPWSSGSDPAVLAAWQLLGNGETALTCQPGEGWEVLFDFEDYVCAHPFITWSGEGSELVWDWAESLYVRPTAAGNHGGAKGNRDEIDGKFFRGFGDTFMAAAETREQFNPVWRAGRYIRLRLRAGPRGAHLAALAVAETRYDAPQQLEITTPDPALQAALPIMIRSLEIGHHEVFCDTPFYEQLMYTGDTHVRLLNEYISNHDIAAARHAITLFDWSRGECGWVAGRYPSRFFQIIPVYSLSWIFMVRDYAWWRDDPPTVRAALPGMRATLDLWLEHLPVDGLVGHLPGWNYLDSAAGWKQGVPPGLESGGSTSVNLLLLLALRNAAELERIHGETTRAALWTEKADALGHTLLAQRWDAQAGLWNETAHGEPSEHAQALAALADATPAADLERNLEAWQRELPRLPRANLYFSFFVFAAFAKAGRTDLLLARLDFWRNLPARGFFTTPEHEHDDCRSDSHAWSAHPLYHLVAGVAGIQPDAPAFGRVLIAPRPAHWPSLRVRCCHPRGFLEVDLTFDGDALGGFVELPAGVTGRLLWRDREIPLPSGRLTLPA